MMRDLLFTSYANDKTEKQTNKQTLIFEDDRQHPFCTAIVPIILIMDSRQTDNKLQI